MNNFGPISPFPSDSIVSESRVFNPRIFLISIPSKVASDDPE